MLFCYDTITEQGWGYPNLARHQAKPYTPEWRQFDSIWPRTVPLRLQLYFDYKKITYQCTTVDDMFDFAWYPVALGWFDFELDYFALMSAVAINKLHSRQVRVLFYYHEGDNPQRIKQRLDALVELHQLPQGCYRFISANTQARDLENFIYFDDHECFFRYVNRRQLAIDTDPAYTFTALTRTHKLWRASIMADMWGAGMLDNAIWSYNTANTLSTESDADNPFELDITPDWREGVVEFIKQTPRRCNIQDDVDPNNHHVVNTHLYTDSYFHIVLETHFDADQSQGVFITEKTYKPIKFGQPFLIAGCAGTLAELRCRGYDVFDDVIDNHYDTVLDNTQRWFALRSSIQKLLNSDLKKIYWGDRCQEAILTNQQVFLQRNSASLNNLLKDLT